MPCVPLILGSTHIDRPIYRLVVYRFFIHSLKNDPSGVGEGEGGGGYSGSLISSDGDDRRAFLGLKFSIPRIFLVGKFGKYFFG